MWKALHQSTEKEYVFAAKGRGEPVMRRALCFDRSFIGRKMLSAAILMLWVTAWGAKAARAQSPGELSAPETARIDSVFQKFAGPASPGCALGVVRDNRLVYEHGYGMASIELHVPITPRTVFDLGSVSKHFTAASIFLLAEQGKLSIDDDIHKYLPELPNYGHPVTIRQLLHHTSGIRDYIDLLSMAGTQEEEVTTGADALAIIARQKELNFTPGQRVLYSNSGYFLLSQIVQRVAGVPLRQFAAERIFRPLGMTSTQILDDHTKIIPSRAVSYAPRKGGGYRLEIANWEQTGDGAVQTTVGDLARWDRNFYHPLVGGKRLIEDLETTGVLNDGRKIPYAAGLIVDRYRGLRRVEHSGVWAGFRANFLQFPDQRVSVFTLCNVANGNPGAKGQAVADILLAGEFVPGSKPATVAEPGETELRRDEGLYWSAQSQQVAEVERKDGNLALQPNGSGEKTKLVPQAGGGFVAAGGGIRVRFDPSGERWQLEVREATGEEGRFVRAPRVRPTPGQLEALVGRYHSPELQVTWSVVMRDGKLVLREAPADPNLAPETTNAVLRPAVEDVFTAEGLVISFERRGTVVTGFTASAPRSWRIQFERVR
jgi:CubicO group peptidase (beta-lactamase class C family)